MVRIKKFVVAGVIALTAAAGLVTVGGAVSGPASAENHLCC